MTFIAVLFFQRCHGRFEKTHREQGLRRLRVAFTWRYSVPVNEQKENSWLAS